MWVFVYMYFLEIREQIQEEITAVIDLGIFTVQCKDRRGVPKKSKKFTWEKWYLIWIFKDIKKHEEEGLDVGGEIIVQGNFM